VAIPREVGELYAALVVHLHGIERLPPGMGTRIWDLAAHGARQGMRLDDVLRATDAELLEARGFGPAALAMFRARVPARYAVGRSDPWRVHADMVAGR
jgi:Ser/Thr protein kinase RdoA (MazF antagonist)